MTNVDPISLSVKPKRGRGRPRLRTRAKEREIIQKCVKEAIISGKMPSDVELTQKVGLGERTIRDIRLGAGLNRRQVAAWVKEREAVQVPESEREILCWTSYAGLWLLVPLIMRSALLSASKRLQWTSSTGVKPSSGC